MKEFKVDKRMDAICRLYAQKLHDSHHGRPNSRVIDKKRDQFETRVNGTKGQIIGCQYFDIPFHWIVLDGKGDGGQDLTVINISLEFKTSWWDPRRPNGCWIPLPSGQEITADYVVGIYGEGVDYLVYGWLTRKEFHDWKRPIPKYLMANEPPGVHSSLCHPIDGLKKIVEGLKNKWDLVDSMRYSDYVRESAERLAILEAELGFPEQPAKAANFWEEKPQKGQLSLKF
jgi:hypothetical protein